MRETMTLSLTCQCIQYQNKPKEKKEIDQRMFFIHDAKQSSIVYIVSLSCSFFE
jgi:hypothetical protein